MELTRFLSINQLAEEVQDLAIKNKTTKSVCGYITCAITQYLSEEVQVNENLFSSVKIQTISPYIDKVMQQIAKSRRLQVKKFMNKMNENQKKNHMTDWVATYQIADYFCHISDKMLNPQVFLFRQVSYDHPEAMENLKYEEAERVKEEEQFKGQRYFFTSFNPMKNHKKEEFIEEIKKANPALPIIISTDVLGHFNTTVLYGGHVYVFDSLPFVENQYDNGILQAIMYYYKNSYLK